MRRTPLLTLIPALVAAALLMVAPAPALATHPAHSGGGEKGGGSEKGGGGKGGGKGGGSEEGSAAYGTDISYPQCGSTFPTGQAFGIVGVDGGVANVLNNCFGPTPLYSLYTQSELYWAASSSSGTTSQPKASLYVNTADPGNIYEEAPVGDWPTEGEAPEYGKCEASTVTTRKGAYTVGANSPACAWVYGYRRAAQDIVWLGEEAEAIDQQESSTPVSTLASAYPWWLDVETANSWQPEAEGRAMNAADLQGMVAALQASSVKTIGVYSTESQWNQIAGATTAASGALYSLPDWIPGARSQSGAESNCSLPSFTGGGVTLTQWVEHRSVDHDHAC